MNWIKQLLRQRRQNDVVKIMTVLFIICMFCIISSIVTGISFYRKQNEPVSYSFEGSTINDKLMKELLDHKNIKNVTPEKTVNIQFIVNGETIDLECLMLSKDYLEQVMGIEYVQSNLFYANKNAMDMIARDKRKSAAKYMVQSEEEEQSYKSCQIEILPDNIAEEGDIPIVYCSASSEELMDATEAIVLLDSHDLDGTIMTYISEKGFQLKEREAVVEDKAKMNETFLEIKYRLIIFIICLVNGLLLKKYALHTTKI